MDMVVAARWLERVYKDMVRPCSTVVWKAAGLTGLFPYENMKVLEL
jgi:hypothetical protein